MKPSPLFYRLLILLLVLPVLGINGCEPSPEKPYPNRPITYLVPWSPGGMTDLSSRVLAAVLQDKLGQPVNVVNRTGGSGVVGHLTLSKAKADGYTIGAVTVESTMMHWQGLTDLDYQKFTALSLLSNNASAITVRADAPWNTVEELVAEIRANPGTLQASGTAKGGIWDLARIGFLQAVDLPESAMPWVPSQGASPALQELVADGVDVVTAALAEVDGLRQAGQVKVLAVMAEERLAEFPDIPTLKEQGIDWSLGGWVSVAAPSGLAPEVEKTLGNAIAAAIQDTALVNAFSRSGFNLSYKNPADCAAFYQSEDTRNGQLLDLAGLKR